MQIKIPVQRPYLGEEELEAVRKVFDSRWLGAGAIGNEFESKLREFLGAKHVLAVNSGTSALHSGLDACGIGPGDEVIVPSLTFIASIQAILSSGARPVFCEVSPASLTIDSRDVSSRITSRSKAIMPVHFGGSPCEMDQLMDLARSKNILVIEDAAHAFGSSYNGKKIGTIGDVTCFSFDPIKNITCGEGGAVATEDEKIANKVILNRTLGLNANAWDRNAHSRYSPYQVTEKGYRYHLSNINAAIGLEQLKRFDLFKKRKQEIVRRYNQALENIGLLRFPIRLSPESFPFMYIVRVLGGKRDRFMAHLNERGIGTGIHYIPNHLQPLFASSKASLPVTEKLYEEILTLPLYFEMTDDDVGLVIESVQSFFKNEG